MSTTRRLVDRVLMLHHVTAIEVEQLRPRVRRIRLGGPAISELSCRPGQHLRVRVIEESVMSRDLLRTYTIAAIDQAEQWLDLYVYQPHEESTPGLDWSRRVAQGDPVTFMGPMGRFVLQPDAAHHLVIGEETAEMAFAALLGAVPDGVPVAGAIEVASPEERLEIPRADEITWTYRGTAPAASSGTLLDAVRSLDLPDPSGQPGRPGVAYVAGEAKAVAAVRAHLVNDRGWPRRAVLTKPFWTPGRKGLD